MPGLVYPALPTRLRLTPGRAGTFAFLALIACLQDTQAPEKRSPMIPGIISAFWLGLKIPPVRRPWRRVPWRILNCGSGTP